MTVCAVIRKLGAIVPNLVGKLFKYNIDKNMKNDYIIFAR
jgi:hypothetical protein